MMKVRLSRDDNREDFVVPELFVMAAKQGKSDNQNKQKSKDKNFILFDKAIHKVSYAATGRTFGLRLLAPRAFIHRLHSSHDGPSLKLLPSAG